METPSWRNLWDRLFSIGSLVATLLFGVAVGNAMIGLPLDEKGNFTGSLLTQLNPYSLVVGVFAVSMFAMHGTIYLHLKTEGELQERTRPWMWRTYFFFAAMYVITTVWTLLAVPEAVENFKRFPIALVVPLLTVLAVLNIPRAIHKGIGGFAFISSAATIAAMVFLFGVAAFPNLVRNTVEGGGERDDLERRLEREDAGDHAADRRAGHALRAGLQRRDLLDVPGEDDAGRGQLLSHVACACA
jgi:cytochrome d ubiquinol oxidase subunit II